MDSVSNLISVLCHRRGITFFLEDMRIFGVRGHAIFPSSVGTSVTIKVFFLKRAPGDVQVARSVRSVRKKTPKPLYSAVLNRTTHHKPPLMRSGLSHMLSNLPHVNK